MPALRLDLAAHIRRVDADHELSPYQLGAAIADFLHDRRLITPEVADQVEDFVEQVNRGACYRQPKPLSPDVLAKTIVDHFKLEEN